MHDYFFAQGVSHLNSPINFSNSFRVPNKTRFLHRIPTSPNSIKLSELHIKNYEAIYQKVVFRSIQLEKYAAAGKWILAKFPR